MEVISNIVEALKKILEEDKKQAQPLFLKTSDNLILNIARMVVQLSLLITQLKHALKIKKKEFILLSDVMITIKIRPRN